MVEQVHSHLDLYLQIKQYATIQPCKVSRRQIVISNLPNSSLGLNHLEFERRKGCHQEEEQHR
jgi:hypothetical protein